MRRVLTALILLILLVPASSALAADRHEQLLIDACQDEQVDGRYSQSDYSKALQELPADTDEYTACRDVIRSAKLAAASSGGKKGNGSSNGTDDDGATGGVAGESDGGSGGAGDPLEKATPKEREAVAKATESGGQPIEIGGDLVRPGLVSADASLPKPLLVLIALLGASALGGAGWLLYGRVIARRAD